MRRALAAVIGVCALLAPATAPAAAGLRGHSAHTTAALPRQGVLVPGESLGGLRLGMTKRAVRARWGSRYGVCADCSLETWYFTYRPFKPQGGAVAFSRGIVARVYTVWRPPGWRTEEGLRLAASVDDLRAAFPQARVTLCDGYEAHVLDDAAGTAFYVVDDRVWGFGLARKVNPACPE